jgi:calcineurin-like phosphoesterase family protein
MIKKIIWVIADPHFGHENILKWCQRKEGFEEVILDNLKNQVKEQDTLICIGDIAWKHEDMWVRRYCDEIKGRKYLCKGNHDKRSIGWYLTRGFDFVGESLSLSIFGKHILFSHKPMECEGFDINIHGHFHNVDKIRHEPELRAVMNDKHILIKCEYEYKADNLQKIVEQFNREK